MKKILLFLLLITLVFSSNVKATNTNGKDTINGIEILDAITLAKYAKTNSYDSSVVLPILQYYSKPKSNKKLSFKTLEQALSYYISPENGNNKFMVKIIEEIGKNNAQFKNHRGAQAGGLSPMVISLENAVGNTDVTNISDAVTQVIITQFKEDLSEIFFVHFQKWLTKPENKDLVILFPNTCSKLKSIGVDIYNYKKYLTDLRIAFKQDLNRVLIDVPKVMDSGTWRKFFNDSNNKNLKSSCLMACNIGNGLINKEHPGKIIEEMPSKIIDGFKDTNVTSTLKLLQMLSHSIHSGNTSRYWASTDTIQQLEDQDVRDCYLALLYQTAGNIQFTNTGGTISLKTIINDASSVETNAIGLISYIKGIVYQAAIVEENTKILTSKKYTDQSVAVADFFSSVNQLADNIKNIVNVPYIKANINSKELACILTFDSLFHDGINVASAIGTKEYLQAINPLIDICRKTIANYKDPSKKHDPKATAVLDFLNKYGEFIGMMVDAQNKDAIKEAIKNSIAGSGGSVVKTNSCFTLDINSYFGGLMAFPNNLSSKNNIIQTLAVTLPIGLSLNFGLCNKVVGSLTFFGSIVDLGAFGAYRLNNTDGTQSLPKTTLSNILAPGVQIILGRLFNTPLSVSVGRQMAPQLRSLTSTNADVVVNNQWQTQISLIWDIPLVTIFTHKRLK